MSIVEIVIASISLFVALATVAIPLWRSRQRHALRWVYLRPKSMLDIADEVADSLKIEFDGRTIKDLTKFQFILHNTGFSPLDSEAISKPLTWHAPSKILAAWEPASDPPVELSLEFNEQQLEVRWSLFNQRCKGLITVLCENTSDLGGGRLEGQIRDVPKIEQKQYKWMSEEEKIQLLRANMELQGKLSSILGKIFYRKWIFRSMQYFWSIYGLLIVFAPLTIILSERTSLFVAVVVDIALLGLLFSLLRMFRNPYSKLMQNLEVRPNS